MKLDKLLHFLAGAVIAAWTLPLSLPLAVAAVILAAVGKEGYDWSQGERFDWLDVLATLGGGAVSLAVLTVAYS